MEVLKEVLRGEKSGLFLSPADAYMKERVLKFAPAA
jgi:hypothetical protein